MESAKQDFPNNCTGRMADTDTSPAGDASPRLSTSHGAFHDGTTEEQEIEDTLGESLDSILDISRWHEGVDLANLYGKLNQAVAESVAQADRTRAPLRQLLFEKLEEGAGQGTAPDAAGLYGLTVADIKFVHRHLLFNGATECCDGTVVSHDSLLLTVAQIGVSLVAYQGNAGTWVQRLYRRDLTGQFADPMEEAIALLERRNRSESADAVETRDPLSTLLRRGLMEYAERAVLLLNATAPWRMGHGNPVSAMLLMPLTPTLQRAGMEVTKQLLLEHRKFVYVASSPSNRLVRTLGDALNPLEYAIVGGMHDVVNVEKLTNIEAHGRPRRMRELRAFLNDLLPELVYGVFRVSEESPAQVFYAHKDEAHTAAAIAMADAALQPHRGFPMLIDLADLVCRTTFDATSFAGTVGDAYSAAGYPLRYLGERETRGR